MTSEWIYKLRKLRGFMILASQLLVTPGIPLWSKLLPSVALAEAGVAGSGNASVTSAGP